MKKIAGLAVGLAMVAGFLMTGPSAQAAQGDMIVPASGQVRGIVGNHCGKNDTHTGTDISNGSGGPVVAAASGTVRTVTQSSATSGYGTQVVIDHGNGYSTRYAHLVIHSTTVSAGQQVSKGQTIGSMGTTGNSTGVHLHFEIRINSVPQSGVNGYFSCYKSVTRGQAIDWSFPNFPHESTPVPASDVDGDNVPDAVDVCPSNTGFGRYGGCDLPRSANSTDFDNDGKSDVFWANPNGQWWASNGGTSPWRLLQAGNVSAELFQFADFNGDGKDDVFYPRPDGAWLVSYGGTSPWAAINSAPGVPGEELQLGDFNGDGKADVFWPHSAIGEWWISYGGTSTWTEANDNVPDYDLRIADFNGDGQDDVFWGHPNGQWWVADSATGSWHVLNQGGVNVSQLKFADLTGDGKAEVFWPNPANGNWWVSDGGTGQWAQVNDANVAGDYLQLSDLNGDGKADVFYPNPNAQAWWMSDKGTGPWISISTTNVNYTQLVTR